MMWLVHLLRNETAYRVSVFERVEEDLVTPLVELFDLLALHVGIAGVAELVAETRCCELPRDPFGDQLDALHYQREVGDRNRSPALGHDVTCESNPAGHRDLLAGLLLLKRSPGAAVCRNHQGRFERSPRACCVDWGIHRRLFPRVEDRLHEPPRFFDRVAPHEES